MRVKKRFPSNTSVFSTLNDLAALPQNMTLEIWREHIGMLCITFHKVIRFLTFAAIQVLFKLSSRLLPIVGKYHIYNFDKLFSLIRVCLASTWEELRGDIVYESWCIYLVDTVYTYDHIWREFREWLQV